MSTRDLTSGMLTAVQAPVVRPVILASFEFSSGTAYLWSGLGDLPWGGNTYTGVADFGSISEPEETLDLASKGLNVSLSGIPSQAISIALQDDYQGRRASVYLGALDNNGQLIADPYMVFGGRMDQMNIVKGGETATVTLSIENHFVDLDRSAERRYTHEDQQIEYPGDNFFEFVNSLQDKEIKWGIAPTYASVPTAPQYPMAGTPGMRYY